MPSQSRAASFFYPAVALLSKRTAWGELMRPEATVRRCIEGERRLMLGSRSGGSGSNLLAVFIAHLPSRVEPSDELESLLASKIDQARRTWPAFAVTSQAFAAYLAEHLPGAESVRESLLRVHADDLFLAC